MDGRGWIASTKEILLFEYVRTKLTFLDSFHNKIEFYHLIYCSNDVFHGECTELILDIYQTYIRTWKICLDVCFGFLERDGLLLRRVNSEVFVLLACPGDIKR